MPIPRTISCSALLINGTVGVGKTSVAEMVGDLLTEAGVPNAVIDLDWSRRSWPSPAGDRFNGVVTLRNLRSVARNYRDTWEFSNWHWIRDQHRLADRTVRSLESGYPKGACSGSA